MLVYRAAARDDDARRMLDGLRESLAAARAGTGASRDAATELLLDTAELETAVADVLCAEQDELVPVVKALRQVTVGCARLLLGRSRSVPTLAGESLLVGDVSSVRCPVPEGFAYYALYPGMYAQAAEQFVAECRPRRVSIVGVRTIGTALSAVVAAAVEGPGREVDSITVRPRGHPFARYLELGDGMRDWIRARADGWFLVVDEGPGISGSSFASVTRTLRECGADPARVALMPSWDAAAEQLRSEEAREEWRRHRRLIGRFEALWLSSGALARAWNAEIVQDWSAGLWRARLGFADGAPPVQPQHERRKFVLRRADGEEIVVKFAGVGRYGRETLRVAEARAANGFAPRVVSGHAGFIGYERVAGGPLEGRLTRREDVLHVARYIAACPAAGACCPGASATELEEMVRVNVQEMLGDEAARRAAGIVRAQRARIEMARTVATDNRMQPHEWIRSGDSLVKTDGDGHHNDHFLPGAQNAAWDLAGACEELVEDPHAAALLVHEYVRLTGDDSVRERLGAYTVAYLASRGGYCRMASDALGRSPDGCGMDRLANRYAERLCSVLASEEHAAAAGAEAGVA